VRLKNLKVVCGQSGQRLTLFSNVEFNFLIILRH